MKCRSKIWAAAFTGLMLLSSVPARPALAAEQIQIEEITEVPTPDGSATASGTSRTKKAQKSKKFKISKKELPEFFFKDRTEPKTNSLPAATESKSDSLLTEAETKPESDALPSETETEPESAPLLTESERETESEIPESKAAEFSPGLYEIISATDIHYLMDIRHCTVSEHDFKTVQTFRSLDVNQQKFYIEELPDGLWRISAVSTGEAFTASADHTALSLTALEHPEDAYAAANQSWLLQDAGDGYFYIRSQEEGYLTLDSPEAYSGAAVTLQEFTGKQNQKWLFSKTWISGSDTADTDLVNPYGEDGPCRNLSITLKFGRESETLTSSELAAHTTENESHQYVLDEEFLTYYTSQLSDKYDTQGQPRRFITTGGREITLTEGDFGWMLDTAGTKSLIQENLLSDSPVTLEPVWSHKGTAFTSPEGSINDIGDSYIEVDLSAQKVWLYQNGNLLLESDCVSGAMGTDAQTPSGVYSIYYMQSPAVLNGPGYSSPVTYWMAFYRGFGLHDATWRTEFGGEIFRTDGSHGCVNLPLENAEIVYNAAEIGYPVVLYY